MTGTTPQDREVLFKALANVRGQIAALKVEEERLYKELAYAYKKVDSERARIAALDTKR